MGIIWVLYFPFVIWKFKNLTPDLESVTKKTYIGILLRRKTKQQKENNKSNYT